MEGLQDLRDRSYLNLAMPWLLILLLLISLFRFCDEGSEFGVSLCVQGIAALFVPSFVDKLETDGRRHAPDLRDEPDSGGVSRGPEGTQNLTGPKPSQNLTEGPEPHPEFDGGLG